MFYKITRKLGLTIKWMLSNGKSARRLADGKLLHIRVAAIERGGQPTVFNVAAITGWHGNAEA